MIDTDFDNYEFQKDLISLLLSGFLDTQDGIIYLDKEIIKRTGHIKDAPEDILPQLNKLEAKGFIILLSEKSETLEDGIRLKLNFVLLNDYLRKQLNDDYGRSLSNSKLITATLSLKGSNLCITCDYRDQTFNLITFKRQDAGGLYLMRYVLGAGHELVALTDIYAQLSALDKHSSIQDVIRKSKLRLLEGTFITSAKKQSAEIKKSIDMTYGEFVDLVNSFVEENGS